MKKVVGVIGLGYVGLPLACLSAIKGFETIGFDLNEEKIKKISASISPIDDPEISRNLTEAINSDNLKITASYEGLSKCNLFTVCVPTPVLENKEPDLTHLINAVDLVSKVIKKDDILIIESTVFPGTCEEYVEKNILKNTGLSSKEDYVLAHCPERVNPGDSFWNSSNIPRVIGATTREGNRKAAEFYSKILGGKIIHVKDIKKELSPKFRLDDQGNLKSKFVPMGSIALMESIRDAEAVKAMENTVRDVNIAFVNELAKISAALELDVVDIIDGMATKPFGKGPFYPGIGVGGHCIAVDPEWLKTASFKAGYFPEIINIARNTNNNMPNFSMSFLQKECVKNGIITEDQNCLILGISYKKNIDDLRESPYFEVKKIADAIFNEVNVFDPYFIDLSSSKNLEDLVKIANILIIVTDHDYFIEYLSHLNFQETSIKLLFDGRNCIDPSVMPDNIIYKGIGRSK